MINLAALQKNEFLELLEAGVLDHAVHPALRNRMVSELKGHHPTYSNTSDMILPWRNEQCADSASSSEFS